jgi:hypothetical protein
MDIEQKGRRIEFEILGKRLNEIYVKTIEQTRFTTNGSENKCRRNRIFSSCAPVRLSPNEDAEYVKLRESRFPGVYAEL